MGAVQEHLPTVAIPVLTEEVITIEAYSSPQMPWFLALCLSLSDVMKTRDEGLFKEDRDISSVA
jgi:hypothetical protein